MGSPTVRRLKSAFTTPKTRGFRNPELRKAFPDSTPTARTRYSSGETAFLSKRIRWNRKNQPTERSSTNISTGSSPGPFIQKTPWLRWKTRSKGPGITGNDSKARPAVPRNPSTARCRKCRETGRKPFSRPCRTESSTRYPAGPSGTNSWLCEPFRKSVRNGRSPWYPNGINLREKWNASTRKSNRLPARRTGIRGIAGSPKPIPS